MADSFTENSIEDIEKLIKKYLDNFKKYYGHITPKLHIRMTRTFGALKNCWVMRFESKHSYFKRVQHSIHNTINTSKSLAKRHQYLQVYWLKSSSYFLTEDVQHGAICKEQTISELVSDFEPYICVKWASFRGISYHVGCAVLTPDLKFNH